VLTKSSQSRSPTKWNRARIAVGVTAGADATKSDEAGVVMAGVVGADMSAPEYPPLPTAARRFTHDRVPADACSAGEGILAVHEPTRRLVDDELHLRADGQRQIRHLVTGREIGENRHVEVGEQVEQEILELVLF
jgi:hypothetical protein